MSVVVLTQTFAYWGERPLHKAISLIVKGKAEIVRADESREIRAGIRPDGIVVKFPVPLVVRLLEFSGIRVKREEVAWSPEAVYERDKNVCQFWHHDEKTGKRFKFKCTTDERTIDHLIPKSRGGKNTFFNTVTACQTCNIKVKKNRTPLEAGMELHRLPETPKRRKGDMVVLTFNFNPLNQAHQALVEVMPKFAEA